MEVGRGILEATQGQGLDWTFSRGQDAIDDPVLEEAPELEIMHQVVRVVGRGMASSAFTLAEENFLTTKFLRGRFVRVELAIEAELLCRGEIEDFLELGHVLNLQATVQWVDALF